MEITEQRGFGGTGQMVGKENVQGREIQGPQPDTELKHRSLDYMTRERKELSKCHRLHAC